MARGYAREVMKQTRVAFLMEYGYPLDVRSFGARPQGTPEGTQSASRGSPASLSTTTPVADLRWLHRSSARPTVPRSSTRSTVLSGTRST